MFLYFTFILRTILGSGDIFSAAANVITVYIKKQIFKRSCKIW